MASPTLRTLTGMDPNPSPISDSALVLIDCQQTYREGVMQLEGVEPALKEAAALPEGTADVRITDGAFQEPLMGAVLGKQLNLQVNDGDRDQTDAADAVRRRRRDAAADLRRRLGPASALRRGSAR